MCIYFYSINIYYYQDGSGLMKLDPDDLSSELVSDRITSNLYNVTNKGIYYFDSVNKQICKSDLKGKKSKAIVSLEAVKPRIGIANGELYYLDNSKDESQIYQMYRVKTNGSEAKSIDY